jgi:hypothetical protein
MCCSHDRVHPAQRPLQTRRVITSTFWLRIDVCSARPPDGAPSHHTRVETLFKQDDIDGFPGDIDSRVDRDADISRVRGAAVIDAIAQKPDHVDESWSQHAFERAFENCALIAIGAIGRSAVHCLHHCGTTTLSKIDHKQFCLSISS